MTRSSALEEKNQAEERQDREVSCHHVREQPHAEGERFGEQSHELDREHDRQEPLRNAVRHQALEVAGHPVFAHAGRLDHDERQPGQRRRHSRVPGGRGRIGKDPQQVAHQDEDEGAEQVWDEAIGMARNVLARQLIPHENHHDLHDVVDTLWNQGPAPGRNPHQGKNHDARNPHHHDVLGDRQRVGAELQNRKVNLAHERQLQAIGVADVMEEKFTDVERLAGAVLGRSRPRRRFHAHRAPRRAARIVTVTSITCDTT